jgi:hypothetical protein
MLTTTIDEHRSSPPRQMSGDSCMIHGKSASLDSDNASSRAAVLPVGM